MLLTIQNLPFNATYNDIKTLVYNKCGIDDIILDNLIMLDNRSKQVTIGLYASEDAAIVMNQIDGVMYNGYELKVMSKSKTPRPANTNKGPAQGRSSDPMQSYGSQGSNWGAGLNLAPPPPPSRMPVNNAPPVIPPFGAPNVYPQQAFYMMNQPAYSAIPSGPSVGYQTLPFGNLGNQGYNQNSWSNNDWNKQQQSGGSQNNPSRNEQASRWDNSSSNWGNNRSNWDDNRSNQNSNRSNRDTNRSERDNRSNRDNGGSRHDEPTWDNRGSRWGDNAEPEGGNRQDSRWNNNDRSNRDASRDRRSNNSNDSKWQSQNRDSNRNTFPSNQSAGPSRDQNEFYRRRDQNNDPPRTSTVYPSGNRFDERKDQPQQNRFEEPRKRFLADQDQASPQKKPRSMEPEVPKRPFRVLKGNKTREERALQIGRMWRGQFIASKARQILADPLFKYEAPNQNKLIKAVESNIKKRLSAHLQSDFTLNMVKLQHMYNKHFGYKSSWEILRDSLLRVHGTLLSKMESDEAREQPIFRREKRARAIADGIEVPPARFKRDMPRERKPKKEKAPLPVAPQYGTVFGNLKIDRRFDQSGPSNAPAFGNNNFDRRFDQSGPSTAPVFNRPANAFKEPRNYPPASYGRTPQYPKGGFKKAGNVSRNNPQGLPLAMIPGRIPQYPKGDKNIFKQKKREQLQMFANDLTAPLFDGLQPQIRNAIKHEVRAMCQVINEVCEVADETDSAICNIIKGQVPAELQRVLQVNVARRIIPILPVTLRAFAIPPIKRLPLEEFLKDYNVTALKKSKKSPPYYIVDCGSIEDHDKLCALQNVTVAGSTLHFKPLHMIDKQKPLSKHQQARADAAALKKAQTANTQRANTTNTNAEKANTVNVKAEKTNTGNAKAEKANTGNVKAEKDEYVYEPTGEEVNDDILCKKALEIYEESNIIDEEIDDQDNAKVEIFESDYYETYMAAKNLNGEEDFTHDVDVDNITNKLDTVDVIAKEPEDDDNNIDINDVDADDLEDW